MTDSLNPTRGRVAALVDDYEHVSQQLSHPVPFPTRYDENSLNAHIRDVFQQAASILKAASVNSVAIPEELSAPVPQVAELRGQVEALSDELDRRTRAFDTCIAAARQIFAEKLDELETEYRRRLTLLADRHSAEESVLEKDLKALEKSFDDRLRQETEIHIAERNEIQAKLAQLRAEYDLTQSSLSSSLSAAKARQELLARQKAMLEATRESVTLQIADKFRQELEALQAQAATRMETLEIANRNLAEAIASSQVTYAEHIEKLRLEIAAIEEAHKQSLDSMMNKLLLQFEKRKRKLEARHQRAVVDLTHQIEIEELEAENEAQLLRTEIEQHKKLVSEAESRFEEAYEALQRQSDVQLQQKDREMKLLKKMHRKAMKQLRQKHQLEIETETHEAQKSRHGLEQKLQQTRLEGEATRKRLENEIVALKRAKGKFEDEVKKALAQQGETAAAQATKTKTTPALSQSRSVVADLTPQVLGRTPEVEQEIQARIAKFTDAGKMELASLTKALEAVEQQFSAEEQRVQLAMQRIRREREFLQREKARNQQRLREMQTALEDLSAPRIREAAELEAQLQAKIASQHAVILQLKDELQQRNADGVKRVDISVIWAEHEEELKQLKAELAKLEAENAARVDAMKKSYEALIADEQRNADEVVKELTDKYNAVMEDIQRTREGFKEQSVKDHQRWMATRKEMADSNNRIMGNTPSRDGSRGTASGTRLSAVSNRTSPLPMLKR